MANRRFIRKTLVSVGGGLLVLVGIVGLLVPIMPGFIFLIPGLFLLSLEFVWADRALKRARKWVEAKRDTEADILDRTESDVETPR